MHSTPRSNSRSGFTLVELLVTISIIAVLMGIAAIGAFRASRSAAKTRAAGDLQTIAIALEAYKQDFGDYPRLAAGQVPNSSVPPTNPAWIPNGAQLLCWALVAPGNQAHDGAGDPGNPANPAPGFRIRPGGQGRVYGPYLNIEKIRLSQATNTTTLADPDNPASLGSALLDLNGCPIAYFPANPGAATAPNYISGTALGTARPTGRYDADYNVYISAASRGIQSRMPADPTVVDGFARPGVSNQSLSFQRMAAVLGDISGNGLIDGTETAATSAPFLLWSAGADGLFGPETPSNKASREECDDVTNFR